MTCKIEVLTFRRVSAEVRTDDETWEIESMKVIDHDKTSDRKWLGTHCFWAMRNMRRVVTNPLMVELRPESN